jgi:hypothetical protein
MKKKEQNKYWKNQIFDHFLIKNKNSYGLEMWFILSNDIKTETK